MTKWVMRGEKESWPFGMRPVYAVSRRHDSETKRSVNSESFRCASITYCTTFFVCYLYHRYRHHYSFVIMPCILLFIIIIATADSGHHLRSHFSKSFFFHLSVPPGWLGLMATSRMCHHHHHRCRKEITISHLYVIRRIDGTCPSWLLINASNDCIFFSRATWTS